MTLAHTGLGSRVLVARRPGGFRRRNLQVIDHHAHAAGRPAGMHNGALLMIVLHGPRERNDTVSNGDADLARWTNSVAIQLLFDLALKKIPVTPNAIGATLCETSKRS